MDEYTIILRIFHILAGVFWVGASVLFFFFIEPAVKTLGPQGGPFMAYLTGNRKMPIAFMAASVVTVIAGVLLYWRVSAGFSVNWIASGTGIGFTVGAVAAIIAFAMGPAFIKPAVDRMGVVGAEIQASGGPPSEAQTFELRQLEGKLRRVGAIDLALLTVAVLAMATARYL